MISNTGFDEGQRLARLRRCAAMVPAEFREQSLAVATAIADVEYDLNLVGDGTGYRFEAEKAAFVEGFLVAIAMVRSADDGQCGPSQ